MVAVASSVVDASRASGTDSPPLAQPLAPADRPGGIRESPADSGPADPPRRPLAARQTQAERILRWALAGRVLHADEWYNAGPDGGSAIKALRSRVSQLESEGYGFNHTRRPDGMVEYRLAYVPERPVSAPPAEHDEPAGQADAELGEQLAFPSAPARPGLYDVDEAA